MPELSTGLTSVRKGDYQLAMSDIFGGNAFLPVLFLLAGLLSGKAVLPQAQRTDIYLTALGVLLTLVYLTGLVSRPQRRIARMGVDSLAVLVLTRWASRACSPSRGQADPWPFEQVPDPAAGPRAGAPWGAADSRLSAIADQSRHPGSTWAVGVGDVVGVGELLRYDHAPGVDHELARLRRVEGGKVSLHPVEPQVRRPRQVEAVRLRRDKRRPLLLGNPKPISVSSSENAT